MCQPRAGLSTHVISSDPPTVMMRTPGQVAEPDQAFKNQSGKKIFFKVKNHSKRDIIIICLSGLLNKSGTQTGVTSVSITVGIPQSGEIGPGGLGVLN